MNYIRGGIIFTVMCLLSGNLFAAEAVKKTYEQSRWDPIHLKPNIDSASNEQCLSCHQEVLKQTTRELSPAGVPKAATLAWYQTLETYAGEQETFHSRHLATPMAKRLMKMKCSTCHQGNDIREETGFSSATSSNDVTMRKMVDPDVCLMCHGEFNYEVMAGLTGPWNESGKMFQNNCLSCHLAFRTNRHNVNYLNAEEIEKAGQENGDSCYGCHGGRSWYRISYPYPRNEWPGMADTPDWAKDRPTKSEPRFLK